MAKAHSKETIITVATVDISTHTNTSQFERTADTHDLTCYGTDDYEYGPGLRGAKFTMGGWYDNGATGTPDSLDPLVGTVVAVVRKAEGTGTGLPNQAFSMTLDKYVETAPVADYIQWSAEGTVTGAVTKTTQA